MDYPFVGQIELFPYNFAPKDWMLCDGNLLRISTNEVLFALIGTTFGGDGIVNFAVPNLSGAEPIPNTNYYISLNGIFPTRQ